MKNTKSRRHQKNLNQDQKEPKEDSENVEKGVVSVRLDLAKAEGVHLDHEKVVSVRSGHEKSKNVHPDQEKVEVTANA